MWLRKLIIFLLCKKLGVKKFEHFQFTNQKTDATYYFGDVAVFKDTGINVEYSRVSLNWLLDPECRITKVKK